MKRKIINSKNCYASKYDKRWNSWLFLNCKIKDEYDIKTIGGEIKNKFSLEVTNIKFLSDKIHTKFSESDKIEKRISSFFLLCTN